ncbi:MAG: SurA N-terminal domain-containing protein [Thermodesulfovibrionia bacterium]
MLELMRSHKFFSVFVLSGITIVIIVTFVFWGIGPKDNPQKGILAQVDKEVIRLDEYWRLYDNEYKRLRERNPNDEEIKKLGERVLDSLIDRMVLISVAKRIGIKVSEDELQDEIMKIPYFQKDGVFDPEIYRRALKLNRLTPQIFEEQLRDDILFLKMSRLIKETAELTEDEKKMIEIFKQSNPQIADMILTNKGDQNLKAYIETIKRGIKIKVNRELIS